MMLKDYVDWKLTHQKKKKSRNLFDKDNLDVSNYNFCNSAKSTDSGVSFKTNSNVQTNNYVICGLSLGNAVDFRGKTITLSSPDMYGTTATKLAVRKGISNVQNGSNWTKSGDVYYSQITVEDKEYTGEILCILLYAYGQQPDTVITYNNIMVNEGSEILPYEPYRK